MKARLLKQAKNDLFDAAGYYELEQAGLGKRFLDCVEDAISRIEENPGLYPFVDGDTRRCLTKRFPFGIMYYIANEAIEVVAIAHLKRKPGYWAGKS